MKNKSIRRLIRKQKAGKEKFITIITHNWKKKIICFALALLLFVFNLNKDWSLTGKSFKVPLKVKTGDMVIAAPYNSVVNFIVHDSSEDLKKISANDFFAYVDTSYVTADGEYDFPVLLELSAEALALDPLEIKVTPEFVHLSLERRISGFVNIEPLYGGTPAFGYKVTSVSVDPSQLEVSGPKSIVQNLHDIVTQTDSISIDGIKSSLEKKVHVHIPNSNLAAENTDATVYIKVAPIKTSKTFEKIPVKLINIDPNLEIEKQPDSVSLTFDGNQADLESYKIQSNFLTADCSNIHEPGTYNIKLTVNSPKYFTESPSNPKTISVVFNEKPIEDENINGSF